MNANATGSTSAAPPFLVPLHFPSLSQKSGKAHTFGPSLPHGWRGRWHRRDQERYGAAGLVKIKEWAGVASDAGEPLTDGDGRWLDTDLHRWFTAMTSWTDEGNGTQDGERRGGMSRATLGDRCGGVRIAVGTQDGMIFVFQENHEDDDPPVLAPSTPMTPSRSANSRHRAPSARSPIPVGSPSSARSGLTYPYDVDGVTSPILPTAITTDVNASAPPGRVSGEMDAEEKLEMQWHAGQEKHTALSGMMEVLGMHSSDAAHEHAGRDGHHAHHQHRHSGTSTPSRKSNRTKIDTKGLLISTTTRPTIENLPRIAIEQGDIEKSELADNGKTREKHSPSAGGTSVESVKPLLCLQCANHQPIISLNLIHGHEDARVLVALQEEGIVTLITLAETIETHIVQLKTDKPVSFEVHASGGHLDANTTHLAGPLARLAALRSQAGSPAPRSRASSNASLPEVMATLPGVSKFTFVQISKGKSDIASNHFAGFFDATQKTVMVIDCAKRQLIARHRLTEIGGTQPSMQLCEDGDIVEVYYVSGDEDVMVQTFRIKSRVKNVLNETEARLGPLSSTSAFLRREGISRPASRVNSRPVSIMGDAGKDDRRDLGQVGLGDLEASGLSLCLGNYIVLWNKKRFKITKRVGDSLIDASFTKLADVISVEVDGELLRVQTGTEYITYRVSAAGFAAELERRAIVDGGRSGCAIATNGAILACATPEDNSISLNLNGKEVWRRGGDEDSAPRILASLPFSMERMVLSLSSGHLTICSLNELVSGRFTIPDSPPLDSTVTLLQVIVDPRDKARMIFGGAEEGDVLVWNAATLELRATIRSLNSPIVGFIPFGDQDNVLRLHGCLACVSADGTVAIIDLTELTLIHMLPGREAALELLATRSNDLLTVFADGRARSWNMKSGDMQSSIGADQAKALLNDGKGWWSQFRIGASMMKREKGASGVLSSIPWSRSSLAGSMTADVRRAVEASSRMIANAINAGNLARDPDPMQHAEGDADKGEEAVKPAVVANLGMPQSKKALNTLRPLLLCLLPNGLERKMDKLTQTILGVDGAPSPLPVNSGIFNEPGTLIVPFGDRRASAYCASSMISASRLVACLAMLNVLSQIEDLHEPTEELIGSLCRLPTIIGAGFRPVTVGLLTSYMIDPLLEVKQAAQTLFVASLDGMPQTELDAFCAEFGDFLPSRRPTDEEDPEPDSEEDVQRCKTLLLLGLIATQRYKDLQPVLLKDIATSIEKFLNDEEHPTRQSVAITLCDRGFSIFQHYFDAMEVVRTFFTLSTMVKEPPPDADGRPTTPNVVAVGNRDLARQATMRIAEDNMPLFMTTLSLDILHARSPEHCSATMRLVAFMVRRKPLVLYPNLPRLAEAVVKSLDPTVSALRTVVHRSATIIISELIAAYPTIAFHKAMQRLAVGTFEGAIIMYDLKTATRLYVLEAHSTALNGLIFSQDGRRLISMCLGDGMLKVWKTGVGIGSLFSFGSAPRQMGNFLSRAAATVAGATVTTGAEDGSEGDRIAEESGAHPGGHHPEHPSSAIRTPSYKSYDFGRMLGPALALIMQQSSPRRTAHHPTDSGNAAPLSTDLELIRFEWTSDRSIRVRIGEASLAFDVA